MSNHPLVPQWMMDFRDTLRFMDADSEKVKALGNKGMTQTYRALMKDAKNITAFLTDKSGKSVDQRLAESLPFIQSWMVDVHMFRQAFYRMQQQAIFEASPLGMLAREIVGPMVQEILRG